MAAFALVLPILPGKTEEWRHVLAEVTGPHRSETEEIHRRFDLTKASWFLQQTPQGDLVIIYLEGDNPAESFQKWALSDHPYDLWFKQQVGPLYGIDFNQPLPGPPSEHVFEFRAR